MENQTLRKYKWFWAWQDDKEEAWLREMSLKGWHLNSIYPFGEYNFTAGEPRDYIYRLDYQSTRQQDHQVYLKLFQDAGWEYVGNLLGWQYFRKLTQPGETMEIFTDKDSKIQKYQRILTFLVVLLPVWMGVLLSTRSISNSPLVLVINLAYLTVMILYIISCVKILQRINQLKKTK
jgi:hypothetical protein